MSKPTDCPFCQIIAGQLNAPRVYEDAHTLAFMDHRPLVRGHVLVIPKYHVHSLYELDDQTAAQLSHTTVRVARALRDALHPDGMSVWQSSGVAAGQSVFHVHIHLVPRQVADGVVAYMRSRAQPPSEEELAALAGLIAQHIEPVELLGHAK